MFLASGPRPPGMASPAPTNKNGAGCPPGWSSPFGLVSGYPVAPNGDVLPWGTFCVMYPHACPKDWQRALREKPVAAKPKKPGWSISIPGKETCGPGGCRKAPMFPMPTPLPVPVAPRTPPAPSGQTPGSTRTPSPSPTLPVPPMPEAPPPPPLSSDSPEVRRAKEAELERWRRGEPPRTTHMQPNPIMPVLGVPGGTILNPVPVPGTRSFSQYPAQAGTGAVIGRKDVLRMAANGLRGTGPATSRAPEGLVYAGVRRAGVRSNRRLLGAIVDVDIRNPAVAAHTLRAKMTAGSTRIY